MREIDIPETPYPYGEHIFIARRNAGERTWQVFVDGQLSPVGYLEEHACPMLDGELRIKVYDHTNTARWFQKPGKGDGCVSHYENALLAFDMELRNP